MIDETILDNLIPVPMEEELLTQIQGDLEAAGFRLTKWDSGGIFYILTRILVRCHVELLHLARTILGNSFVRHATGRWLVLKGQDYSKEKKEAIKTQGYITIKRNLDAEQLIIPKGHMFKTKPDSNGEELKYYVLEDAIIRVGMEDARVLVEAQYAGTDYNVSQDRITISMIYLSDVKSITNEKNWIFKEGAEEENEESFRNRCLASWSELSTNTIRTKLKLAAESVPGVLSAYIDDQHPRGQGTVDIIITGSAGEASETLIANVQQGVDQLRDNYEDYLVKSAEVVYQNVEITIYLAKDVSVDDIQNQAKNLIENLMQLSGRELNVLLQEDITYVLKQSISGYKKTVFTTPMSDVVMDIGKVIVLGSTTVQVTNMKS